MPPLPDSIVAAIAATSEHLPGEPALLEPSRRELTLEMSRRIALILVFGPLLAALLPLYLGLRLLWGRPPLVPSIIQVLLLLTRTWTTNASAPAVRPWVRIIVTLAVIWRTLLLPLVGVSWIIDEILFGRALDSVRLVAPIIELSAARSGSTQLGHYLEEDPQVCAPSVIQVLNPYLWAWRWLAPLLSRVFTRDSLQARFLASLPPGLLQRHEADLFRTDTFEVMFMQFHHHDLWSVLSPQDVHRLMSPASLTDENRAFWADFVRFFDRVARKTSLHAGGKRVLIKGHFVAVAPALERKYPEACFVTVLRAPDKRLQSTINHHRYQPRERSLPLVPWSWLARRHLETEIAYCDAEMAFYSQSGPARRVIVCFEDFVVDLEGTMRRVYGACFDTSILPPHVRTHHSHRERSGYLVDRQLIDVGIDPVWVMHRLDAWCGWAASHRPDAMRVPSA